MNISNSKKVNHFYLISIAFVSAMGGLLFGYDWVVIGGAKPFYELFFSISDNPLMQGWAMGCALLGCVIGAILSGFLADSWGRKKPLILAGLFFAVSAFGTGYADTVSAFVFFRVLGGVGIGLASTLSPLYIAEMAPAHYRGRLVSLNQLTIVIGILLAQIVNYGIAEPIPTTYTDTQIVDSWNGQMGWRFMFLAEGVPALLFLFCMFLVPESPRFLVKKGRLVEAAAVIQKIANTDYAYKELAAIKQSMANTDDQDSRLSKITGRRIRPIILLGAVLAIFQQWCGINIIFNYAQEVFASAGYGMNDILFNIIITGSVNLIFTLLALRVVDKWGRRSLLRKGALGLAITYALLGMAYYLNLEGIMVLVLIVMGIGIYAMTLAPITWVVLSEIFPNKWRGKLMAVATLALWIASFLLTYTFPVLHDLLETSGVFWAYGVICLLGYVFITKRLPETKGKSLEEIEVQLIGRSKLN